MRAVQRLLFADPQPLVEKLGLDFFRGLPEVPGVYLMRDDAGVVLYVGKAKNLRKRLNSYRVANPERLARRHLRLLRAVAQVEWLACADEAAALSQEAALLRTLRPKFNRVGTWPGKPRFLAWDRDGETILLRIAESGTLGKNVVGPMGRGAEVLRAVLARLLWFAVRPERGIAGLPVGWLSTSGAHRPHKPGKDGFHSVPDFFCLAMEEKSSKTTASSKLFAAASPPTSTSMTPRSGVPSPCSVKNPWPTAAAPWTSRTLQRESGNTGCASGFCCS
ncbi:MAG: nucleotide excision repair endonuclease [Verrucomicrobia bacterium]|nr:nucleotide excision repair endonuclease [Verrucomicrobiota bacterium]